MLLTNERMSVVGIMELREQLYILAIAEHGSIKHAAEELCVAPPTLSIFLNNYEKKIGGKLFDKLGHKFIPTEIGQVYISAAKKIVSIANDCDSAIKENLNLSEGTIRFGIHTRRTLNLLAKALLNFSKLYPNIEVITYEENTPLMYKALLDGELDFIITNRLHNDSSLIFTPFYKDRLVAITPKDHPKNLSAVKMPNESIPWIDLALFSGERFILQKPVQSCRYYTDKAIAYSGAVPLKIYVIENMEAAAQLAAEGLGIAFSYVQYAREYTHAKPFSYFLVGDMNEIIEYNVVFRRDKFLPKSVHDLIEVLTKIMNEH